MSLSERSREMKVSVIIPTMKGREVMLARLLSTIPDVYEKIIVDDEDLLLAAKRNKGARQAKGDYLFFIDDDNYLEEGAIDEVLKDYSESHGVVGITACYDDKKGIIADGGSMRNYLTGFTRGVLTNKKKWGHMGYLVDEVANAFMIPKKIFEEVGGFDEENFPIDLDEADICKRIKNMGYSILMAEGAFCYHKSQTYNGIPNFRRRLNAYTMGNHRIRYQRKHLNALSYWVFVFVFCPVFVCFYTASLIWKRNPKMIKPFLHGVIDGLRNCRTNQYK